MNSPFNFPAIAPPSNPLGNSKNTAWNQEQTRRMLACPVNQAIVACVKANGPVTCDGIKQHLAALGLQPKSKSQISNMVETAVLRVTTPYGKRPALYAAGERAALFVVLPAPAAPMPAVQPTKQAEPAAPAPEKWVGYRVPPRQYDVMHAPAWVPPMAMPARPGASDFLACPTRGHRC